MRLVSQKARKNSQAKSHPELSGMPKLKIKKKINNRNKLVGAKSWMK